MCVYANPRYAKADFINRRYGRIVRHKIPEVERFIDFDNLDDCNYYVWEETFQE